ncbi:TetR/AcrR family transcriptional regulator [Diaminobutyricibacter sp. McL0618]|uniref:TetR/AcrR family transcriptional regulator n=1 Tax=Leifsonia sp. McL0618 TaxID=3415677 RepID=UPI003CF02849
MTTKREQTRERLLASALELFRSEGYDATSVAEIARAAGVTEMTFFRYFPSKQSLLVDDPYDPLIGEAISRQPTHLDPLTRAARGIRDGWRSLPEPSGDEVRSRLRIVAATPSLRATLTRGSAETEAVIAEALTTDETPHRTAQIAASAVMSALSTALLQWSVTDSEPLGSAIEAAADLLEDRHG